MYITMANKKNSSKKSPSTNREKRVLAWHFLPANMQLGYADNRNVKVGKTLSCIGTPHLCNNGLHASTEAQHAASFKKGPVLTRVQVWGEVKIAGDKIVGKNRKCIWAKKLTGDDIRSILKDAGKSVYCKSVYSTLNELVDTLGVYSSSKEVGKSIEKWARKNGCVDPGKTKAQAYTKPKLEVKHILPLLSPRVIQTTKELLKLLEPIYDITDSVNVFYDLDSQRNTRLVDCITHSGDDGWVCLPRKR